MNLKMKKKKIKQENFEEDLKKKIFYCIRKLQIQSKNIQVVFSFLT